MAIAIVGSQVKDVTFANPKTLTSASTTLTDVLYTVQYCAVSANTVLSGWTSISGDVAGVGGNHMLASARLSDGAANYIFTQGGSASAVAIQAFSGADASVLSEQFSSNTTNVVPSVTPTFDNSVQILIYGTDGGDGTVTTAPSGGTGTYALIGVCDDHATFGSLAIYSRTFGAGTGGASQAAPTTPFAWGGGGTVREIITFVIRPVGSIVPIRRYGMKMLGVKYNPLNLPANSVYEE